MAHSGQYRLYRYWLITLVFSTARRGHAQAQNQLWNLVEENTQANNSVADSFFLFDWWLLGLLMGMAILIGVLWYVYRMRMDSLHAAEAFSDAEFESEVLRSLSRLPTIELEKSTTLGVNERLGDRPQTRDLSTADLTGVSSPAGNDRVDVRCGWVIEALRQAGVVADLETLEMRHGFPKAAAELRLSAGGRALLLQDVEPLPALLHSLARYDILIVAGTKGKAVVIRTVQQTIADRY
jgi:hypothetical protein